MSENTERLELMAAELDGNAVAWRQSAQRHRARGTDADAEACEKMAVNSEREAEWYRSLIPLVEAGERAQKAEPQGDPFLGGVCVALRCVTAHDCGTVWREIVESVGVDDLLNYAAIVEPDNWSPAGFGRYARLELGCGRPRKPLPAPPKEGA